MKNLLRFRGPEASVDSSITMLLVMAFIRLRGKKKPTPHIRVTNINNSDFLV